jgi:hypothetical protein
MVSGRKPTHLTVVPVLPGEGRPEPPLYLGREEAEVWRSVVARMPADWFRTSEHLLQLLCTHTATARALAAARSQARGRKDWITFKRLSAMLEREGQCMARLSSVLRLCPRSRTSSEMAANHKARIVPEQKPWGRQ